MKMGHNVNNFVRCIHESKKGLPQFKDFKSDALSYKGTKE